MPFDEKKVTEVAAYLLRLRGGKMHYLKLVKLLYIADREALKRWGSSLTGDNYVSMYHGPVVSKTYNLMVEEDDKPFWSRYISAPMGDYEIELRNEDCPTDRLSRAEEKLLNEIYKDFGYWNRWKLRDFTHKFPEWSDPGRSSTPISLSEMLSAQGIPTEQISAIESDRKAAEAAVHVLGRAR